MTLLSSDILEVFGLDWVSMLFYLGNFVLLIGVLVLVLYKPVKKMLKKKRESVDGVYEENEKLKAESEKLKADYEKMVENMRLENARIAAQVAESARKRADEVLAEAQAQAQAIISSAQKQTAIQMEQLTGEYRESVNNLAVQIAQKLLEREITEKDNSVLIEQVLSDWESD